LPVCKGKCKPVPLNSLAPGEEIQNAIAEKKNLADKRKELES
jgi:hypothetical protein